MHSLFHVGYKSRDSDWEWLFAFFYANGLYGHRSCAHRLALHWPKYVRPTAHEKKPDLEKQPKTLKSQTLFQSRAKANGGSSLPGSINRSSAKNRRERREGRSHRWTWLLRTR